MALMKQHSGVIKKYIALLESMGFAVTEIKNGRGRHTIYILEEIGKTEQQKLMKNFLKSWDVISESGILN